MSYKLKYQLRRLFIFSILLLSYFNNCLSNDLKYMETEPCQEIINTTWSGTWNGSYCSYQIKFLITNYKEDYLIEGNLTNGEGDDCKDAEFVKTGACKDNKLTMFNLASGSEAYNCTIVGNTMTCGDPYGRNDIVVRKQSSTKTEYRK